MIYEDRDIDHRIGKSVIWTERVIPAEEGDIYVQALYRKSRGGSGMYEDAPTYMSTDARKRSRKELASILNNLRNYHE